jgi:hypothetical protein
MYNWSVDTTNLKKNPAAYEKFVLEQRINFGLNGQKLSIAALKKHWSSLDINPAKKSFLQKLLWPQAQS